MTPPILEVRGLHKTYDVSSGPLVPKRTLHALAGVDLSIPEGGVLGLVGESGSGKSTLARLAIGLEAPTSGEILLGGKPLSAYARRTIARDVQPVFQDPFSSLNPSHSVAEIIGLPLSVHRIGDKASRRSRVATLIDQVGLPARTASARPRELSGGQRQRVAIARALAIQPKLLVCDEPTSALDVSVQAQILNLLADLRRDTGVAMLFISHNLAVVEHVADTVAVLYLGRVVEEGAVSAVFEAPRHPYTAALRESVLDIAADGETGLPELGLGTATPDPINVPSGCRFHPRCPKAFAPCDHVDPMLEGPAFHRVACHL
ncbi:ABC transporter ATP-binding protein [Acuticoccus kandeliae]|uniref:ABC transporter ATP-binding protein n=1 Tax=Acuticoccus kandeliae TaxID=2073160 RepID=UPI000D3EC7A2|nr:oligopeptide/dipeptide ABC transporter ATP-binding protein [Acuticoccus kandeliae]